MTWAPYLAAAAIALGFISAGVWLVMQDHLLLAFFLFLCASGISVKQSKSQEEKE